MTRTRDVVAETRRVASYQLVTLLFTSFKSLFIAKSLSHMSTTTPNRLHQLLMQDEDVEKYVITLTSIAEALGLEDFSYTNCFERISRLSEDKLHLELSKLRLEQAETELKDHLAYMNHELALIRKWKEELNEVDLTEKTAMLERKKSMLSAKAKEYQKSLDSAETQIPEVPISITELSEMREGLRKKEQTLKEKRARLQAFQGLPPNLELARLELQGARQEQMQLIQLRERLLSVMASSVS
ncbi:hypothetical protein QCA50_001333 [Cerrena zonata]|uniref:Uncharacterized protein n=1 Tax=Cerrena zonata TaxID=2478898 RepID=A0AAW0GKN6_9APHY